MKCDGFSMPQGEVQGGELWPPRDALVEAARLLWEWCCRLDEPLKARTLLENLPYVIDDEEPIALLRDTTAGMLQHLESPAHYAWFYDAIWEADPPRTAAELAGVVQTPRARWALETLRAMGGTRAIDLGAGSGFLTLWLASQGIAAYGINLTQRCVTAAQDAAHRLQVPATFLYAVAEDYRLAAEGLPLADVSLAFEIVEHVADPDALVASMEANVRPGGVCLLTTPNGSTTIGVDEWSARPRLDHPLAHVRAYTPRRMREWLGHKRKFAMAVLPGPGAGSLWVRWERPA